MSNLKTPAVVSSKTNGIDRARPRTVDTLRPSGSRLASFSAPALVSPLLATLLLVASCDVPLDGTAPDGGEARGAARAQSDAPGGVSDDESRPSALERTALEPTGGGRERHVEFEVGEEAVSMLIELALADAENGIGITGMTAPDGSVVHDTLFEEDSWEAVHFESAIAVEPAVGTGDIALALPVAPGPPPIPGTWRVEFETDPSDAVLAHASAIVRLDPGGRAAAKARHVVDLHVHVLHPDARYRGTGFPEALDTDWRSALDRVLAPHGLGIGTTRVSVASSRETTRLAELDDEREIASACRTIRRVGRPPKEMASEGVTEAGTGTPELHVGLVATISGDMAASYDDPTDVVTDDLDDPDAEEAALTGLSPQPGLAFDDESPNACVFVAERPWRVGYADGDAPDEATVVELLAANLLHELGHFAGLAHPSETDGRTFDLLDDTPRCTEPDPEECGVAGGADNLMFHSGDESTLPWTLTPDQAWVLRRHALFRPAAADGP